MSTIPRLDGLKSPEARMARFQNVQTVSRLGLATALLIGTSSLFVPLLFAAEVTSKSGADDASPAAESPKSKSTDESKSKKWKSEGAATPKTNATHRPRPAVDLKNSAAVAAAVDHMILENLTETGTTPAPRTSDEDFLRRIHFDLAGTVPLPREVTLFGLNPDSEKRLKLIDRLLSSEEYADP
jgi:Protein of unknown function (DUF1549)